MERFRLRVRQQPKRGQIWYSWAARLAHSKPPPGESKVSAEKQPS